MPVAAVRPDEAAANHHSAVVVKAALGWITRSFSTERAVIARKPGYDGVKP